MKLIVLALAAAFAGWSMIGVSFEAEAAQVCRGRIGNRAVEDVVVPAGATCTLWRTRVDGNVEVKRNATLIARGVFVDGNIQAERSARIVVNQTPKGIRSRIGGDIQAFSGGRVGVNHTTVGGNIQVEQNRRHVRVTRNRVEGDIQLFSNTGGVRVAFNRADGNLQCKSNQPRPTGRGNIIQGNKEDQCAGM